MTEATITEVIEGIAKNLCNSCFKHHHFCPHKGKDVCPIIDEFKRSAYKPYYKKWETKPNADIPTEITTCVGVAMALIEDEPQTDCPWK